MQSFLSILSAIERGEVTPRQAVAKCFDATAAKDAEIGAFRTMADRETTLAAAEQASGPLAGIAVGVKDIFDTHDMPTEFGSAIHAGNRPAADAAIVAMLRAKGAVVAGKTVTTEFAFLQPADTRNPRNPAHTPGGSSSGSAAAVAAGMVPIAIGTQTGGSVIRPAAYCGVAGYKPSFRLLPMVGAKTFSWSLDTAGFFAAGVADVAAFVARLTGRALAVEPVDPSSLRIGLYRTSLWEEAAPDMQAAVELATDRAGRAGATIVEVDEPSALSAARAAHLELQNFEAAMALAFEYDNHRDRLSDVLRQNLEQGRQTTPEAYDEKRRIARRARRETGALFETVDVLLTPAATGAAPEGLSSTGSPVFNKLWTLTGNPCINVPGITDASGMPLGVQVLARFGRDRMALSVAWWLQALLGDARIGAQKQ
ncbi:Asp-tRNAAsn/Glu-tRNAGln amidotransferase A subunit [Mesorhizobium albiziae]|uniref:Asp-tRNAAsn/Glu-tRNAGln amidotransferase A subunit n=1 Tax=Neomesorhizobium albiziae TaxID=335020 RepID=A0A1I3VFY1_9HYPH|nr:amidase [Mesorhizobium albiziae]GLS28894.1 amidase [Mesorhizobium albiziae]SFJ94175.1 Asp-tRNAAsn/Glu-tRNAGln amidotransferase A subunit [Mesorhizobium albiziae]